MIIVTSSLSSHVTIEASGFGHRSSLMQGEKASRGHQLRFSSFPSLGQSGALFPFAPYPRECLSLPWS